VKAETLKKLYTPVISPPERKDAPVGTPAKGKYALGWGEVEVKWATRPLLHHAGSNGRNLAHIWVDKEADLAVVLVTNISNRSADEALFDLAPKLYQKYAKPPAK